MKRKRSPLSYVRRATGGLLAVFVLLTALEFGARAFARRGESGDASASMVKKAPVEGGEAVFHIPNQSLVDNSAPGKKYRVTINSLGFRGREFAKQKPENTVRIMLLGDSAVFGEGVDDSQTIPRRMEEMLNAERPAHRHEVVNAGIAGAFLDTEIDLYYKYAARFQPDSVVLAYSGDDIAESAFSRLYEREFLAPEIFWISRYPPSEKLFAGLRNSALFNLVLRKRAESGARKKLRPMKSPRDKIELMEKGASPPLDLAVEKYEKQLLSFHSALSEQKIEFLFIIFPTEIEDVEINRPVHRELAAFASENGIPALDLRASWLAGNPNIHHFFDTRGRPTPEALNLAAAEVNEKIQNK